MTFVFSPLRLFLASFFLLFVFSFAQPNLLAQAPEFLNLRFNTSNTQFHPDDLYIYFDNGGGVVPRPFDVRYNGGLENVTFGTYVNPSNETLTNHLSNAIRLSDVTNFEFQIYSVTSVAVFVTYGSEFTTLSAAPSFFLDAVNGTTIFQNFEITRTGADGDQGNLTNINYFTAPMSITSYNSNSAVLQHTSFSQSTAQVYKALDAIAPDSKIVYNGQTLRFVGPSTYPPNPPPYPSFVPYMQAAHQAYLDNNNIVNTISNHNAFNTNNADPAANVGANYDFTFSFTTSFETDLEGNVTQLILTGDITTQIIDFTQLPHQQTAGPTFSNATIIIDISADEGEFNSVIYGQQFAQNPNTVTFGQGWTDFANYINNDIGGGLNGQDAVGTTQRLAIGEISSAILMSFLANTTEVDGIPLYQMSSSDWWKLDPTVAFSDIQSNPLFYNQWANEIFLASFNGSYSIPYSDRLGTGPLVNSVQFQGDYVTMWEIGIFDPVSVVPEPSTWGLVALGLLTILLRRRFA